MNKKSTTARWVRDNTPRSDWPPLSWSAERLLQRQRRLALVVLLSALGSIIRPRRIARHDARVVELMRFASRKAVPEIARICRGAGNDLHLADEAWTNTQAKILKRLETWKRTRDITYWARSIGRNQAFTVLRTRATTFADEVTRSELPWRTPPSADAGASDALGYCDDIARRLDLREASRKRARVLRTVLYRYPDDAERLRGILKAYYSGDCKSVAELARASGENPYQVRRTTAVLARHFLPRDSVRTTHALGELLTDAKRVWACLEAMLGGPASPQWS